MTNCPECEERNSEEYKETQKFKKWLSDIYFEEPVYFRQDFFEFYNDYCIYIQPDKIDDHHRDFIRRQFKKMKIDYFEKNIDKRWCD